MPAPISVGAERSLARFWPGPALRPPAIPDNVRDALRVIPVGGGTDDPDVDEDWGEPGLTPAERVIGWNTLKGQQIVSP